MARTLEWDSGELGSVPGFSASLLGDLGKVTSPLGASVSSSEMILTSFVKYVEIYS